MRSNFIKALLIFIVVWAGAFISRKTGYYNSFWFTDIGLHILSGVGFAIMAQILIGGEKLKFFTRIIFILSLSVVGGYFWELWEFSGWHLVPTDMPFYGPILSDSLGDIASGLAGAVLYSTYLFVKNPKDSSR